MRAELVLPRSGHRGDTRVILDDNDITNSIRFLTIEASAYDDPRLILEYACDRIEINGDFEVVHRCPEAGRER